MPGVATVGVGGAQFYSMRIWLDPDLMAARGVTVEDVESAPSGLPAVDHLVQVERVLQGSVPGTSLIVRVPASQRFQELQPGERAVLSLAPSEDGSFRLLGVERGNVAGEAAVPAVALASSEDRANPAATSLGTLTGRGDDGWMAAEKIVKAAGAEVVGVAVIVDRGARPAIEAAGLEYRSAYTLADLGLS